MKILVINAGSSSLKYQLIDMADESVIAKGICERVGTPEACISFKTADGQKIEYNAPMSNHTEAFAAVKAALPTVTYTGVSGEIAFDEIGDAIRDTAYIKTVDTENGVWKLETVQKAQ